MSVSDSPASPDLDDPIDDPTIEEPTRPPLHDGPIRAAIDLVIVAACAAFVFWQLHPNLILADTTPAGGDMGAHVWAFGYLRDVLLPSGRLSGWTPDWYAGFPAFQFYMVVPFLGMVVLNAGFAGVGALVPAMASLALSAKASGLRWSARAAAAVAATVVVVALIAGVWSSYAQGFGFACMAIAVAAAITAARFGRGRHRGWLVAAAVAVATVGISMPYGTAFKLITVLGVVAMPVSAYIFGRLARFPYPTPALLAVATLAFLFDKNFTIYGGNIASTMAGEFAFSISLALAIAYLGVVIHGLRTGTHRATAAVLLALVGLCHLIPAFFAIAATAVFYFIHVIGEADTTGPRARVANRVAAGAAVLVALAAGGWFLIHESATGPVLGLATAGPVIVVAIVLELFIGIFWWSRTGLVASASPSAATDEFDELDGDADPVPQPESVVLPTFGAARSWWLFAVGSISALLAAWWVLPFYVKSTYLNDMGWEKIAVHVEGEAILDWWRTDVSKALLPTDLQVFGALALVGAVLSVTFRNRIGSALVLLGLGLATAFVYAPQGRLWNARLLPFWYLVVYFLAAVGVGEVVRAMAQVFAADPRRPLRRVTWLAAPVGLLMVGGFLGGQLHNVPGGKANPDGSYRMFNSVGVPGVFSLDVPDALAVNVKGRNFVTDWSRWNYSGYERKDAYPEYRGIVDTMANVGETNGCGMSLWEYSPDLNSYGTPMALMLLPHWTDGCIGSMEGLYFEASSTTPFHFLMQSELSKQPSRAQRDLPYRELDLESGVDHLQLMGVRYYMARSPEAIAAADAQPDLTRLATSTPWVVYEVADAEPLEPLSFVPAVTTSGETQHEWLCADKDEAGRCTGAALDWFQDSSQWDVALAATGPDSWERVDPGQEPKRQAVTPARVSNITMDRKGISFDVDQIGTPILVKESYFPNWEVSGADGPYRVAPNLMVVVPTDTHVEMTFGRTGVDIGSMVLTVVGIALVVMVVRRGRVTVPELRDSESPLDA